MLYFIFALDSFVIKEVKKMCSKIFRTRKFNKLRRRLN